MQFCRWSYLLWISMIQSIFSLKDLDTPSAYISWLARGLKAKAVEIPNSQILSTDIAPTMLAPGVCRPGTRLHCSTSLLAGGWRGKPAMHSFKKKFFNAFLLQT